MKIIILTLIALFAIKAFPLTIESEADWTPLYGACKWHFKTVPYSAPCQKILDRMNAGYVVPAREYNGWCGPLAEGNKHTLKYLELYKKQHGKAVDYKDCPAETRI